MSTPFLLQQYSVYLGCFIKLVVSDSMVTVLQDAISKICLKQHAAFLYSCGIFFSFSLKSKCYRHAIVLTGLELGRIFVLFSQIRLEHIYQYGQLYYLLLVFFSMRLDHSHLEIS